jgi:hypothetical protein
MITNFSTTIKLFEKILEAQNLQSTVLKILMQLMFAQSWDSCFQVGTIKKSVILEWSTKLKNSKQNIFLK